MLPVWTYAQKSTIGSCPQASISCHLHLFNISFNIILPYVPMSPTWHTSFKHSNRNFILTSSLLQDCYSFPCIMSLSTVAVTDIPTDADFLCNRAAVLRDTIKVEAFTSPNQPNHFRSNPEYTNFQFPLHFPYSNWIHLLYILPQFEFLHLLKELGWRGSKRFQLKK